MGREYSVIELKKQIFAFSIFFMLTFVKKRTGTQMISLKSALGALSAVLMLGASAEAKADQKAMTVFFETAAANSCQVAGTTAMYTPVSSNALYQGHHGFLGMAKYTQDVGYQTFLDTDMLQEASPMLRAFIAAHECGHHVLGHSHREYDFGFVSRSNHLKFERQADCYALRSLRHEYGLDGDQDISALFKEVTAASQNVIFNLSLEDEQDRADMLNALPASGAARLEAALKCPLY